MYIGGENSAKNKPHLLKLGVKCIVNCTSHVPNYFPEEFLYHNVEIDDVASENIQQHFDKTVEFIDAHFKKGEAVLIHCVAGVSRSASVLLAYLMKCHHLPLRDAYELARSKRPRIFPNIGFWKQLIEYEKANFRGNFTAVVRPNVNNQSFSDGWVEFIPISKL